MSLTWKLLQNRWRWKLLILSLALASAALGLAGPIYQKHFVDSLILKNSQTPDLWFSFEQLIWFFVFFLASVALQLAASYLGQREATLVQKDLGHALYSQMLSLKADRLRGTQVGSVVSLYTTDAPGSGGIVELALTNGALVLFPLLLAPFMLRSLLNVSIAPLLVVMFVSLAIMVFLSMRQSRFFWNFKKLAAERTGIVNEWVQNIRALRSLGWVEAFEKRIFLKREEETQNRVTMVSNGQIMASLGASVGFFLNLAGIFALVKMRPEGDLTPGELTATFWALGVYLAKPLRGIPWILTFTLDSYTSIKRVESFLGLKSEDLHVDSAASDLNIGAAAAYLEIEKLSLTLDGKQLLKDISLKIQNPEFVAVVGAVGSGKTLFVQSLLGEVPAHFHRYSLLGKSVKLMTQNELKANFSMVPQDAFIASTTIQNNVFLEYDSPPLESLELEMRAHSALENASLSLKDEGFLDREATVLGERGVNLSGGQRQRLGIARALFAGRPVLILDDALSAVDVNIERRMMETLFKHELKNTLVFLITHRHLTLPSADRVLFLKDGQLKGDGTFSELMETSQDFKDFLKEKEKTEAQKNELR